jgi:adenylate cyclase, class 2
MILPEEPQLASIPEADMLEVEIKYRVGSFGGIEDRLGAAKADLIEVRDDADTYFNAPHRDFAKTDEALRVRQIGSRNLVTYKGPRIDPKTKTRSEIEAPLGEGAEPAAVFMRLLAALGFRPVAEVRKHRRVFELLRGAFIIHVCLDDVERVGRFAEVEIVAEEEKLEPAKVALHEIAAELGLVDSERRSYLELLLASSSPPK